MEKLNSINVFVRAAETLSFVAAGRALGVSASAVGKSVANLEASLGVRLFRRTTRRVALTEEGALFHERCRRILDDLRDAEAMLTDTARAPRGRLRIGLPAIGYRFLLPVLPEFGRLFPDIDLDLDFDDRIVDLIENDLDAVIRSGDLTDSTLVSRRLGPFRFILCASPDYLARRGQPHCPQDLETHECLRYRVPTTGKLQEWSLPNAGTRGLMLPTAMTCSNMEAIREAALRGLGIAYMPDFLALDPLQNGSLCRVLEQYPARTGQFWVLWPSSRHLSPKLRVFVDYLCGSALLVE